MLKAKKYKERIKELDYNFALCEGELEDCQRADCENCKFSENSGCTVKKVKWLLEEYKEPILLTDKEKAYLKNVVEPKKDDVFCIRKWRFYEGTKQEYATVTIYEKHPTSTSDNSYWTLLDFVVTEDMPFEGMELHKEYTLEELGLC